MHRNPQSSYIRIPYVEGYWISISVARPIILSGDDIVAGQRTLNSEFSIGVTAESPTQLSGTLAIFARGGYFQPHIWHRRTGLDDRSAERRVGKECRSRWS